MSAYHTSHFLLHFLQKRRERVFELLCEWLIKKENMGTGSEGIAESPAHSVSLLLPPKSNTLEVEFDSLVELGISFVSFYIVIQLH